MVFFLRTLVGVAAVLFADVEALRSATSSTALEGAAVSEAEQEKAVRALAVKDIVGDKLAEIMLQEAFVEVQKEGASGSNGTASAIAKTLGPALDQMLSGLLKGMKPIFKDVCTNVVEDVALQALEQNESDVFGDFNFDRESGDDGISYISFVEAVSANSNFWDNVKGKLFGEGGVLAPALQALGKMIKPTMEKLGEKISPKFGGALKKLLEKACQEARNEVENGSM